MAKSKTSKKYSTLAEMAEAIRREGRGDQPPTPEDSAEMLRLVGKEFSGGFEALSSLLEEEEKHRQRMLDALSDLPPHPSSPEAQKSLAREIAHALAEQRAQRKPKRDGPQITLAKKLLMEIYPPNGVLPPGVQAKAAHRAVFDTCEERGIKPPRPSYDVVRRALEALRLTAASAR